MHMPAYVIVESQDPFESKCFSQRCELALTLLGEGSEVTLFLVENAVMGARVGAKGSGLQRLAKAGVRVLADDFALRERGISQLATDVVPAGLDALIGELACGAKTLWN
jgi:sulfur relay (sulfurtransferase) complex TusBCD TusD component (DsrE family)